MSTPPSIPAPPLPEGGQSLVNDCEKGYPYGYDVDGEQSPCVPVDPCLIDGVLYLDYEYSDGDHNGTTLWTIMSCSLPTPDVAPTPTALVASRPATLAETGADMNVSIVGTIVLAAGIFLRWIATTRHTTP